MRVGDRVIICKEIWVEGVTVRIGTICKITKIRECPDFDYDVIPIKKIRTYSEAGHLEGIFVTRNEIVLEKLWKSKIYKALNGEAYE